MRASIIFGGRAMDSGRIVVDMVFEQRSCTSIAPWKISGGTMLQKRCDQAPSFQDRTRISAKKSAAAAASPDAFVRRDQVAASAVRTTAGHAEGRGGALPCKSQGGCASSKLDHGSLIPSKNQISS